MGQIRARSGVYHFPTIPVMFEFLFLPCKITDCWKPLSKVNHCNAPYSSTQQRVQIAG